MQSRAAMEEEEEFQSCCAEEEEWQDTEEELELDFGEELDEFSVRMLFKGVSVTKGDGLGAAGVSGIGVVMERPVGVSVLRVQKKMDFFVGGAVAEHLALLDGLVEALGSGVRRVFAFTDSKEVYDQIAKTELLENQLLVALGLRILEHAEKLEAFVLKLVPSSDLKRPLQLAREAAGLCSSSSDHDRSFGFCSVCVEEKQQSEMIVLNCSHKLCFYCLSVIVEDKLESSQYSISSSEVSSSSLSDMNCIECPQCRRLSCISCGAPWHSSMTCEEYHNIDLEERDVDDTALSRLVEDNQWRHCPQCRQLIELTEGCPHMVCRCGNQFCYSCGAEYRDGVKTCYCAFLDEENIYVPTNLSNQESELWIPSGMDAYSEQERVQLALIQRFLAGGFGLGDHQPCQSPPCCSDSYMDTIKDLYQLPWLERFVSVISDTYHDDHIQ